MSRYPAAVLMLDLTIYSQHVMFHVVPLLWRLHRMHHADPEFEVTHRTPFSSRRDCRLDTHQARCRSRARRATGRCADLRGQLNATSMFNHGNVRLPAALDRMLRLVVVTPDMHRVHHSIDRRETDSNFGFNVPWWDRLFGTYRDQPALGHDGMTIGIDRFRAPRELWLDRMLRQPLRRDARARNRTTVIS